MANTENAAPSFSDRAKTDNLPTRIKMEALADLGTVTYEGVRAETATVPGDGTQTDGFLATVLTDKGIRHTCFIGGVALVDTLSRISFPFRASLKKDGRTWVFAD